jgi:hypothetical protein
MCGVKGGKISPSDAGAFDLTLVLPASPTVRLEEQLRRLLSQSQKYALDNVNPNTAPTYS